MAFNYQKDYKFLNTTFSGCKYKQQTQISIQSPVRVYYDEAQPSI